MLPSEALNREFVLDEVQHAEQQRDAAESGDITSHGVQVGNIGILLPRQQVSEQVKDIAICRIPNTSTWFNGVTSLRGNMIPIFDLHILFDISHEGVDRRTIIVGEGDTAVAFWVDGMPRMITLSDDNIMTSVPPIPSMIRDHAHKYYLKEGQIWVDWNVRAFFTTLGSLL